MANAAEIAKFFSDAYYKTLDTNRAALGSFYQPNSVLTYEGEQFVGADNIAAKFVSLSFQTIEHAITSLDNQIMGDGLLICVLGQLKADQDKVFAFNETFYLKQMGESLFVMNQIFRLNLHHQ